MMYTDYSTIGRLYIDNEFICYTLENTCRENVEFSANPKFSNAHIKASEPGVYNISRLAFTRDSDIIGFFDLRQFEHVTFGIGESVGDVYGFIALGCIFSTYSVYSSEKAFLNFISRFSAIDCDDDIQIEIRNI